MKRQIIIDIDCEKAQCGECKQRIENVDEEAEESVLLCQLFHDEEYGVRGPLCLAAESKFRALVEAGQEMADDDATERQRNAWDSAVREAKR